jgi:hypothetical protein
MNEVFPLEREVEAYESIMRGKVRFSAVLTTTGHQGFESITIFLMIYVQHISRTFMSTVRSS